MKIIIATRTQIVFESVRLTLLYAGGVQSVVLSKGIGETFITLSREVFDVCLLDLDLPGAKIVIPELTSYWPTMRLVGLGDDHASGPVTPRGRMEFLRRQSTVNEIASSLTRHKARTDAAPIATDTGALPHADFGHDVLSLREAQIASLIARGSSNKAIARELSIKPSTVKNHVHNILGKLGISNRARVAARLGMLRSRGD